MPDTYASLIPDARGFFADLSQNNTRDWFHANKPRYDSQLKAPAKHLLDDIAVSLGAMLDQPVTGKLYRPNRDVRFSKDKTPYSLHLHLLWTPQGNGTQPGYFFGIAENYVTVGAGLMGFDKRQQAAWRAWVSEPEGAALQRRIDAVIAAGGRVSAPELKRIPVPFGPEHAQGELLRRKSLTLWTEIEAQTKGDLTDAIMAAFRALDPVMEDLRVFL